MQVQVLLLVLEMGRCSGVGKEVRADVDVAVEDEGRDGGW